MEWHAGERHTIPVDVQDGARALAREIERELRPIRHGERAEAQRLLGQLVTRLRPAMEAM